MNKLQSKIFMQNPIIKFLKQFPLRTYLKIDFCGNIQRNPPYFGWYTHDVPEQNASKEELDHNPFPL